MTTTHQRLDAMLSLSDNWNTYDANKPSVTSIAHAKEWIAQFQQECGASWIEPNITPDAWGEIVFEWWHLTRKLSIFVGPQRAEYLKSWQGCAVDDMEDGDANTPEERATL